MSKPQSDLIESCFHNEVSRRDFFDRMVKFGVTGAVAALMPSVLARALAAPPPPKQDNWRVCYKCATMFYNGFRTKGRCPKSGAHLTHDDSNYRLTYNSPGPGQRDWRFCNKCNALFFNGDAKKGVCAAGGGHFAQGFNFTLRYDNQAVGRHDWRYCNKCQAMFYDGESNYKGVCAAGNFHVAAGYKFVLDDTVGY